MEGVPDLGEERIDLGTGPVISAAALTFRAPVAALQDQPGAGVEGVAEGAAEGLPGLPKLTLHKTGLE